MRAVGARSHPTGDFVTADPRDERGPSLSTSVDDADLRGAGGFRFRLQSPDPGRMDWRPVGIDGRRIDIVVPISFGRWGEPMRGADVVAGISVAGLLLPEAV